jgi:hypothetical protein
MSIRSVTSVRMVSTNRSACAFRLRGSDRCLDHPRAVAREDAVECGSELAIPVADEELKLPGPLAEIHHQIAGLLGGPGPGRTSGDAQDVHRACLDLHREQHVRPLEQHRGAGSRPTAARIRRMVPSPTGNPGRATRPGCAGAPTAGSPVPSVPPAPVPGPSPGEKVATIALLPRCVHGDQDTEGFPRGQVTACAS